MTKGFSLLELVLAMTMLSVIILGSTTLESSVMRLTAGDMEVSGLQNQLLYAYRAVEKDMNAPSLVSIDAMPDPLPPAGTRPVQFYQWRVQPQNGTPEIRYVIDLSKSPSRFQRIQNSVTQDLLPQNVLTFGPLKYPAANAIDLVMWMSNSNKMVTFNLGLQSTFANNTQVKLPGVRLPGFSKSILIRTGKVQDCRSGVCI